MTAASLLQIWIFATGIAAVLALQFGGAKARRWAPVVGLAGQPAWLWYAWQSGALGVGLVSLAYTAVWAAGCVHAWPCLRGDADHVAPVRERAERLGETIRLAYRLADADATMQVECECPCTTLGGVSWYDTDPDVVTDLGLSPDGLHELTIALRYLELRDLIVRDDERPSLVRFVAAIALPPSEAPT